MNVDEIRTAIQRCFLVWPAQLGELFIAARLDRSFKRIVLFIGIFADVGAAVGCIAGNPIKGACIGALLGTIGSVLIPYLR